jgi:DNA-binding transcriptional ArsR family regulator
MTQAARALPEPSDEMVITDVEQLKAVSDPLRLQLLDAMADDVVRGWTAKELAEHLGTRQTKLYHHLGILEERGFIRVAETRVVSGIIEKRYQATARSYRVERALLTGEDTESAIGGALDAVFAKARNEILAGLRSGDIDPDPAHSQRRGYGLWATNTRLSPAKARKVMRLIERLREFDDVNDPDGVEFGLLVGFYPRATRDADR